MRIHAHIAVNGGNAYMGRFPVLPSEIDAFADPQHGIDVGKVRVALREYDELITWSDKDDVGTVAFMIEFMRQMQSVTNKLEEDDANDTRTVAETANDRALERRMDRGKYAVCRIECDRHGGHLRVRIGYANPKGVIGAADNSCRRFAVYAARIIGYMAKELNKFSIELVGVGEAADVFEEAEFAEAKFREYDRIEKANETRKSCVRRLGEYCSPSDPNCACYKCGKCVEAKIGEEWQNWENYKNFTLAAKVSPKREAEGSARPVG